MPETNARVIQFTKDRDTKNTVRYAENVPEDDAEVIGTLYVKKFFAKGATGMKVTLEPTFDAA